MFAVDFDKWRKLTTSHAAVETINKPTRNRSQLVDMILMNQQPENIIEIEAKTADKTN